MKVVVTGGGIGGLTFAAAARRFGLECVVVERAENVVRLNPGSGLGLWPSSMACLDTLGITQRLEDQGAFMPSVSYQRPNGSVLAQPSSLFSERFPVLCIHRDSLQRTLYEACIDECGGPVVEFRTGVSILRFEVHTEGVRIFLSDHSIIDADVLVGADGIHSAVRKQLIPSVQSQDCGYVYFRATLDVSSSSSSLASSSSSLASSSSSLPLASDHGNKEYKDVGISPFSRAFETWGQGRRFGYVPLKQPEVFWFASIPSIEENEIAKKRVTQKEEGGPERKEKNVSVVDETTKQWLLSLFTDWKGPLNENKQQLVDIQQLINRTDASAILRTKIRKVPKIDQFPWYGEKGRVILLGDSAHATSPNLAQGAGLSIEDAIVLAAELSAVRRGEYSLDIAAKNYEINRKPRAKTVQTMADMVATVGQLRRPLSIARDLFMIASRILTPRLQSYIFERTVALSLGGNSQSLTWVPPLPNGTVDEQALTHALERRCLMGIVLGREFSSLPKHIRTFRVAPVGEGTGYVSVELGTNIFVRLLAKIMGLPQNMVQQPFAARVETIGANKQLWTRKFGVGSTATIFATTHTLVRSGGQIVLSEGAGGILDHFVRFTYSVQAKTFHSRPAFISYVSHGLRFLGLPLPSLISPNSSWVEEATDDGWTFDGELQLPIFGRLMHYFGKFCVPGLSAPPNQTCGRVVIAGGSGLLGSVLCGRFLRAGWKVIVLSRSGRGPSNCNVAVWDGRTSSGWSRFVDSTTVLINLAGENPGARRWNESFKSKIESSRLEAIDAMAEVIKTQKPRMFLQASATGIYGNRGDEQLRDSASPSYAKDFRVNCTKKLEAAAIKAVDGTGIPVKLLRLGHLLSRQGGLLPYLELASRCGASRLGSGTQFIPWIHIHDAAEAIVSLAEDNKSSSVPSYNICSPNPATNSEFFQTSAEVLGRFNVVPIPGWLLQGAIGESNSVILDSQRTFPDRLLETGFEFTYPTLKKALLSL